jgi:hypothetical protein
MILRHPTRLVDPDALAKLIDRRGEQVAGRAQATHEGIVAFVTSSAASPLALGTWVQLFRSLEECGLTC